MRSQGFAGSALDENSMSQFAQIMFLDHNFAQQKCYNPKVQQSCQKILTYSPSEDTAAEVFSAPLVSLQELQTKLRDLLFIYLLLFLKRVQLLLPS